MYPIYGAPLPAEWSFRLFFFLTTCVDFTGILSWILLWISQWFSGPSFKRTERPQEIHRKIHTKNPWQNPCSQSENTLRRMPCRGAVLTSLCGWNSCLWLVASFLCVRDMTLVLQVWCALGIFDAPARKGYYWSEKLKKAVAVSDDKIQQGSRRRGRFSSSHFRCRKVPKPWQASDYNT